MTDLSSQPTPLQTIYGWYRGGSLIVNRNYQRKLVWTLIEKQQLIDSILKDYPIPLVLLSEVTEDKEPRFEIMDGLQRLHTIVSFIEHGFPLADGRYFNVDEFTRAKEERDNGKFEEIRDASTITRSEVSKILDYILPVSVVRHSDAETVTDIFGRINSYGHRLSDQERRQAGLVSDLSKFVRIFSAEIRGDVSVDRLPLHKMPEISVDLATTKYGYKIQASDVFWVRQGILRSTELRDSLDEQVVADLAACILNEEPIERSKDALDLIYQLDTAESATANSRLSKYPEEKLSAELKYCLELVDKIVLSGPSSNLRDLVFPTKTTNSFPTIFSAIALAIHELSFKEGLVLADPNSAHGALTDVQKRMNSTRKALSPEQRRRNVNLVKGLVRDCFVTGDVGMVAFGARRELDIENTLRRSEVETPRFEIKQGLLNLDAERAINEDVVEKVIKTTVAIANISPEASGTIFVGVADTEKDAVRIEAVDGVAANRIGNRWIVGVDREATKLGWTPERYFQYWRDKFISANISQPLKSEILGNIDLCLYKNVHILIINVKGQKSVSLYNGSAFIREGDQTIEANAERLLGIVGRFGG